MQPKIKTNLLNSLIGRAGLPYYYRKLPHTMKAQSIHTLLEDMLNVGPIEAAKNELNYKLGTSNHFNKVDDLSDVLAVIKNKAAMMAGLDATEIDNYTACYLGLLSVIHLTNQDQLKDNLPAILGGAYFSKTTDAPSCRFINKYLLENRDRLRKLVGKFLIDIHPRLPMPMDIFLQQLSPSNTGLINVIKALVSGTNQVNYELDIQLRYQNKLHSKLPLTSPKELTSLVRRAAPTILYDNINNIHQLPPLFLVSYLYFTKMKSIPNIDEPAAILDAYWFTDEQEDSLIFQLNSMTAAEFNIFNQIGLFACNFSDTRTHKEAICGLYRILRPFKDRLTHFNLVERNFKFTLDMGNSVGETSELDATFYADTDDAKLITLRKGLARFRLRQPTPLLDKPEDIRYTSEGTMDVAVMLGEYSTFCAQNGVEMSIEVFERIIAEDIALRDLVK